MAMINLGMVLQERRRLKEAAGLFRSALAVDPDNAMGNSNLGQVLVEIGRIDDLDEAERCCLKAIRLTPDRPHPINNLGNVYRSMGRFEEAVACYEKATAIAPGLAMPLNNKGQALQGPGPVRRGRDALPRRTGDGAELRQVPRQLREPPQRSGPSPGRDQALSPRPGTRPPTRREPLRHGARLPANREGRRRRGELPKIDRDRPGVDRRPASA